MTIALSPLQVGPGQRDIPEESRLILGKFEGPRADRSFLGAVFLCFLSCDD